jgi:uncharacterized membrane protein
MCPPGKHISLPCLNRVSWQQPFVWLRFGWEDFLFSWSHSLAYGIVFSLFGFGLVNIAWSHHYLAMTLTTGFLLVSPFLAAIFYALSRQREQPDTAAFASIWENLTSIGLFALTLMFVLSVWERISAILIGNYLGPSHVRNANLAALFTMENMNFVITFMALGAILGVLVFAISVVSLPMLMDRRVDIVTAVMTSLWTVRENPLAMLLWAAIIVVMTAIGIATWFIGLAVIFPILGHATWHAYRGLVQR